MRMTTYRTLTRLRRATKWTALAVLLLAVAGTIYEQLGQRRDRQRFPQVGRSVDVGGRSVNLYCSGDGSPAVILESGHGVPGLAWAAIQRQLASVTNACWYDRAGYGWSETAPSLRRSNEIARDLHALVTNAGVPPPYVLVGERFGAFNVRAFRRFYPDEVAGMVLIDPPSEDPSPDNPSRSTVDA
jgi:pimeloyl-ACP methyl ester carboxylesterase